MSTEKKEVIGIEAMCFKCGFVWNISLLKSTDLGVSCEECGGYVVSPSGKAKQKLVYEGETIESPLLDPRASVSKRTEYKPEDIPTVFDFNKFKQPPKDIKY